MGAVLLGETWAVGAFALVSVLHKEKEVAGVVGAVGTRRLVELIVSQVGGVVPLDVPCHLGGFETSP